MVHRSLYLQKSLFFNQSQITAVRSNSKNSFVSSNYLSQFQQHIIHKISHTDYASVSFQPQFVDDGAIFKNFPKMVVIASYIPILLGKFVKDKKGIIQAYFHLHYDSFDMYTIFSFSMFGRKNFLYLIELIFHF
jgi:hypothetical protein